MNHRLNASKTMRNFSIILIRTKPKFQDRKTPFQMNKSVIFWIQIPFVLINLVVRLIQSIEHICATLFLLLYFYFIISHWMRALLEWKQSWIDKQLPDAHTPTPPRVRFQMELHAQTSSDSLYHNIIEYFLNMNRRMRMFNQLSGIHWRKSSCLHVLSKRELYN